MHILPPHTYMRRNTHLPKHTEPHTDLRVFLVQTLAQSSCSNESIHCPERVADPRQCKGRGKRNRLAGKLGMFWRRWPGNLALKEQEGRKYTETEKPRVQAEDMVWAKVRR